MSLSRRRRTRWVVATGALIVVGAYLWLTPPGVLTKFDMVGYAVCHRIPSHSFFVSGRQLPLCVRCTGTFIGALTGLLGQALILRRRRESEFPRWSILAVLIGFILVMGFDGLNSYLTLIPNAPHLYEPLHLLRLITGALNGLALSSIVLPLIHFSLWKDATGERVIQGWRDLAILVALEAGMVIVVLTRWPPLLYPLAIASAAGVLAMLTLINTVLVAMAAGRENKYSGWRDAAGLLMAGFALALLEVGAIDLLRYTMTGTLEGFPGLS